MPKTQQQTVQDKRSDWPMLGTFFYQLLFFVFMQVLLKCTNKENPVLSLQKEM